MAELEWKSAIKIQTAWKKSDAFLIFRRKQTKFLKVLFSKFRDNGITKVQKIIRGYFVFKKYRLQIKMIQLTEAFRKQKTEMLTDSQIKIAYEFRRIKVSWNLTFLKRTNEGFWINKTYNLNIKDGVRLNVSQFDPYDITPHRKLHQDGITDLR